MREWVLTRVGPCLMAALIAAASEELFAIAASFLSGLLAVDDLAAAAALGKYTWGMGAAVAFLFWAFSKEEVV